MTYTEAVEVLIEMLAAKKSHIRNYESSNCVTSFCLQLKEEAEAIETVLADREKLIQYKDNYKGILKRADYFENKCIEIENNSIPKDKIRGKIDEYRENVKKYIDLQEYNQADFQMCKANVLQELLEEANNLAKGSE